MNYNEENNNLVLKFKRFRKINKDKYIHDFVPNLRSDKCSNIKIGRWKLFARHLICLPIPYNNQRTLFGILDGKFVSMIDNCDMKLLFMTILVCGEEDKIRF